MERKKKEMLLLIVALCCQSINEDARTCVVMMTSYFISERVNWISLRLGRGTGNVKLYNDNIGSARQNKFGIPNRYLSTKSKKRMCKFTSMLYYSMVFIHDRNIVQCRRVRIPIWCCKT